MKDYTQVERDNAAATIEDAANNLQEAINMAIAALREKQQRQPDPDTGCPECSWIDPALSDCNYCKNCGRRLRDALIERTEVER